MAKMTELCNMLLFSISPNLCQHTTMWNTDAPILHSAKLLFPVNIVAT